MSDQKSFKDRTLAELTRTATMYDQSLPKAAEAEIARRIAQAQIDSTFWMKISVAVIALSSTITAVLTTLSWLYPHAPH